MTCTKRKYRNELHAILVAAKCVKDQTRNTAELRVYKCPHCKAWHLTRQKKKETPS